MNDREKTFNDYVDDITEDIDINDDKFSLKKKESISLVSAIARDKKLSGHKYVSTVSQPVPKQDGYLTLKDAADYLAIHPWTLLTWTKKGVISVSLNPKRLCHAYKISDLKELRDSITKETHPKLKKFK